MFYKDQYQEHGHDLNIPSSAVRFENSKKPEFAYHRRLTKNNRRYLKWLDVTGICWKPSKISRFSLDLDIPDSVVFARKERRRQFRWRLC